MNKEVKRLYNEALANQEFNLECKEADPSGYIKPNMFSSPVLQHLYGMAYYGWLVGKKRYKHENYHY